MSYTLVYWVSHLQDESVLSRIEQLQSQKQDWWNLISDEEKAEIEEGISQADRGETKRTDEVLSTAHSTAKSKYPFPILGKHGKIRVVR